MDAQKNMQLMQTLDDAWNTQDWDTFNKRHAEDVAVYWPGQSKPTRGRKAHEKDAKQFFKTFPDNHVGNRPYKILFAQGDYTCSVADFTGTMKGPLTTAHREIIFPSNKSFNVELCMVACWNDAGEILAEKLFYDVATMMKQLSLIVI
ncbi:MAG: ester cyclase [Halobacteriota archaeon]